MASSMQGVGNSYLKIRENGKQIYSTLMQISILKMEIIGLNGVYTNGIGITILLR